MSTILNSESFDRAAHTLARSMDNFKAGEFSECVRIFEQSVSKMARLYGMQAANDQRKAVGDTMLYTEQDFLNA